MHLAATDRFGSGAVSHDFRKRTLKPAALITSWADRQRPLRPIMQRSRLCKDKSRNMIQQQAECRRRTSRSLHNRGVLGEHTGKQSVRSTMDQGSDHFPANVPTLQSRAIRQYLVGFDAKGNVLRLSSLSSIALQTTVKIMSSVRQRQFPPGRLQPAFCQKLTGYFP